MSATVDGVVGAGTFRLLALGGVLVLTAAYVSVLQDVTSTVGGTRSLLAIVLSMLIAATVLAHTIRPRTATAIAIAAGAAGFAYYLTVTGPGVGVVFSATGKIVSDTVALATGLPLLRMVEAGIWTLGFAPAPVFLSWYLALRGRYALSVVPGGAALLFLVLTGDAGIGVTLLGTLGGVAVVGFGELERRGGSIAQADLLAILFALMIVLSMSVTLVPGGAASPTYLIESDDGDGTLEGTITTAPDRSGISGQVELSPEVRFTAVAEEESYWRTGVYDRFTGDEWVRSGQDVPYEGAMERPPGEYETNRQTIYAQADLDVMPAAPHPIAVEGDAAAHTEVSMHGQIRPATPLMEGDVYNVESAVVERNPDELREAGTDYPEEVTEHYLQLPEGTSSEFESHTAEVVADAENPYEKAAAIESHLRESKGYSLDVDRPGGNVAEEFVFEMDEGYCVYFATSMVQMLRAEDVPARYAVGFSSGQQVDDNEWVVRGLDAHAWVEVYFPDHGWVAFEPTPGDRDNVHDDRLEDAREDGEENVDVEESEDVPPGGLEDEPDNETETPDNDSDTPDNDSENETSAPGEVNGGENVTVPGEIPGTDPNNPEPGASENVGVDDFEFDDEDEAEPPVTPTDVAIALALLVGLAASAHRTGLTARAKREGRLYWHGFRGEPAADAERAYRRLEELLARQYRPRRRGESTRQYLSALSAYRSLDRRALRVGELYERARYGAGVDREEADEAIEAVDALARRRLPLIGRRWR